MSISSTWQFNLIAYLISIVLFFQFYKLAVKHTNNDGAATILLQLIAALSALCFSFFTEFSIPTKIHTYLLLIAACFFYAINDRLMTTARKHLQVSLYSVLSQLSNVILIVYGILIFQNPIVLYKILGALFILAGNFLVLYKKGGLKLNKYVLLAILVNIIFATAITIDIGISDQFNLPLYIFFTFAIPAVILLIAERMPLSTVFAEYYNRKRERLFFLLTGFFWFLAIFFSLRSFQYGSVSLIVPLQAVSVLLNVLVATVFLGEKDNLLRKTIAALIVITGIYFTVFN